MVKDLEEGLTHSWGLVVGFSHGCWCPAVAWTPGGEGLPGITGLLLIQCWASGGESRMGESSIWSPGELHGPGLCRGRSALGSLVPAPPVEGRAERC